MLNIKRLGENMKKILTILLMSISIIALTGCKDPVIEETPIIEQVKTNLVLDEELTEITLPTEIDGVTISWQSSKPGLITSEGVITKPNVDTSTSLTAIFSYDSRTLTKIFEVVILGAVSVDYNLVEVAADNLTFDEYNLIEDVTLPSTIDGISITWQTSNATNITSSGAVTRPAENDGNVDVTLTAILSYNEISLEKEFVFTVIDLSHTVVYIGYYSGAGNLEGDILKAFLHDLIDDHTVISYASLWNALAVSDKDPLNSNNIILFYTGVSISKEEHGGDVGEWNREHVWAKYHGDLGSYITDSDMHHIRPTDVMMNNKRSSLEFDNGGTVVYDGDIATDNYSDSDSWEPRDEVKGDVARMIFYMAVRYEGENPSLDLEINESLNNGSSPSIGKLSVLLEWHLNDLPDAFEINRNDVIETYQHNRNPFIDHPEFAELIWGIN